MAASMPIDMAIDMPIDPDWKEHRPKEYKTYVPDKNGFLHKVPLFVDDVQNAVDPDLTSGLGIAEAGATEAVSLFELDLSLVDFVLASETQPASTDSGNIINADEQEYLTINEQNANEQIAYEQEYLTIRNYKTIIQDRINHYSKPINFEDKVQWDWWCTAMNIIHDKLEGNEEARAMIVASYTPEAISARQGFPEMPMAKLAAVVIEECWAGGVYNDMDLAWRVSPDAFWATMDLLTCWEMVHGRETARWVRTEKDGMRFLDAIKDLILEKRPAPVVFAAVSCELVAQFENMVRSFSDHEEKMLAVMPYYSKPLDFANDIQMGAWNEILYILRENIIDGVIRDRIINAAMPDAIAMRGFPRMPMAKLLAIIIHEAARYGPYDTEMFWRVHEDALEETLKVLTCECMMESEETTEWLRGGDGWMWMEALKDLILQ